VKAKPKKWGVVTATQYVSGQGGGMAWAWTWTYDRKEADDHAKRLNGRVVDAVRFTRDLDYRVRVTRAAKEAA